MLEIERKFIVKLPSSWEDLDQLFSNIINIRRIEQSYLKNLPNEQSYRIRKSIEGFCGKTKTIFDINQKKKTSNKKINKEKEKEISEKQYNNLLKDVLSNHFEIQKTRYVFKYNDQIFELDVFKNKLKGLVILEIELKNKDQKVELPPFLKVVREVTKEEKLNNFELSKLTKY